MTAFSIVNDIDEIRKNHRERLMLKHEYLQPVKQKIVSAEDYCMSMLARYKRPGGFLQLLSLIESFGPQKREKFMEMIQAEDPVWAKAIQTKLLTVERIFSWPEQVVSEVVRTLPTKNLACMMKGISAENAAKVTKFMSHAEKRKLDDEIGTLDAKPDEIFASFVKTVEQTRKMIKDGQIRLEKVDADLAIMDGFEEHLAQQPPEPVQPSPAPANVIPITEIKKKAEAGEIDTKVTQELLSLHNALASITKENKTLKDELKILRDKLEQIRKIA